MKDQLKINQKIYFIGESIPMEAKAINDRYCICTRELDKEEDYELIKREVEVGAYCFFEEAYDELKKSPVYSCLDFEKGIKAPHNLIFNPYDFEDSDSINQLLDDLTSGQTQLSQRNFSELEIDFKKTFTD